MPYLNFYAYCHLKPFLGQKIDIKYVVAGILHEKSGVLDAVYESGCRIRQDDKWGMRESTLVFETLALVEISKYTRTDQ